MSPSETEMRATEIIFEEESGSKLPFAEIPVEDRERILGNIENRRNRVEQFVLHDMLIGRISEGRRVPRRHMVVAFAMLVAMMVIIGAIIAIRGA